MNIQDPPRLRVDVEGEWTANLRTDAHECHFNNLPFIYLSISLSLYIYIYIYTYCRPSPRPTGYIYYIDSEINNLYWLSAERSAFYLKGVAVCFVSSEIMRCRLLKLLSDHPMSSIRERGSVPKRGLHSTIWFSPNASAQWQHDGFWQAAPKSGS